MEKESVARALLRRFERKIIRKAEEAEREANRAAEQALEDAEMGMSADEVTPESQEHVVENPPPPSAQNSALTQVEAPLAKDLLSDNTEVHKKPMRISRHQRKRGVKGRKRDGKRIW